MDEQNRITPLGKNKKTPFQLNKTQKLLLFLMLILALMTTLPILMVLLVGLLPTFTLMIIDIKNINKILVVGCFNLSGVFVYMFNVLRNFSVNNAMFIFSDVFNMILMLGSAAIGLIVYYELPQLFVYIAKTTNQNRIENIDSRVEKLKELWGQDILHQ